MNGYLQVIGAVALTVLIVLWLVIAAYAIFAIWDSTRK